MTPLHPDPFPCAFPFPRLCPLVLQAVSDQSAEDCRLWPCERPAVSGGDSSLATFMQQRKAKCLLFAGHTARPGEPTDEKSGLVVSRTERCMERAGLNSTAMGDS